MGSFLTTQPDIPYPLFMGISGPIRCLEVLMCWQCVLQVFLHSQRYVMPSLPIRAVCKRWSCDGSPSYCSLCPSHKRQRWPSNRILTKISSQKTPRPNPFPPVWCRSHTGRVKTRRWVVPLHWKRFVNHNSWWNTSWIWLCSELCVGRAGCVCLSSPQNPWPKKEIGRASCRERV